MGWGVARTPETADLRSTAAKDADARLTGEEWRDPPPNLPHKSLRPGARKRGPGGGGEPRA